MRKLTVLAVLGATVAAVGPLTATPAAQATFPGANGKIAFSTDFGGDPQIFSVNPSGSGETQLTQSSDGHAVAPDWSPDGTKIVFQGDQTGNQQIYEMNANGSGRHQLINDPGFDDLTPTFSPDGTKIAFSRCPVPGCAVYTVNADGTGLTQLTSGIWNTANGAPRWSPDGTRIAFDSNQDGLLSAVWVMNADGTNQQRLTAPLLEADFPDWSPTGKNIVFTDNCCGLPSNVWVMNSDGSGLKQLTHFPTKKSGGAASYSPDGKKIVLVSTLAYKCGCLGDLYTMDANGTHLTRIVADQPAVFRSGWGTAP